MTTGTRDRRGISTRVMLVAALVAVITSVTLASLLIVRNRMRQQVANDLSMDLARSVDTFESVEAQRLTTLQRENALLADLPSLKALMTTGDERTISDGAVEFWKVSGNDLFALATRDGHVQAVYTKGAPATAALRTQLERNLTQINTRYILSDGRLFEYSVRPLYFGNEETGSLLGYVLSGYAIDADFVRQVSHSSFAEAVFIARGQVIASTLPLLRSNNLEVSTHLLASKDAVRLAIGGEQYIAASRDLSKSAGMPLQLVVMRSLIRAEHAQHEINRLVATVGLLALLIGSILMVILSSLVTRPLEQLAQSVRAFGAGNSKFRLPARGTLEVRELSAAFASMRQEIQEANRALLESERLATIGRMASSVSHDLRHYLAAVYANAEFLASSQLSIEERADLFADIRMAVHGTTELIESLLIFSRTGRGAERSQHSISALLDRALALIQAHPDAAGVEFQVTHGRISETAGIVDARQMERALYNLLLNACQSARSGTAQNHAVHAAITVNGDVLSIAITDNGPGVSNNIRDSLFEPFVSEGKQKGTGLGLTLAQCIAQEHGGSVMLVSSRPGETIFSLTIRRGLAELSMKAKENSTVVIG